MKKTKNLDARSGIYTIGPDDAEALLLDAGAKNRPVSQARVNKYVTRMNAGAWRLNGEPIILSESGKLLDGEHRLRAVVSSRKPLETVVLYGAFSFASMGQGAPRSGSDALALALPEATNLIALQAASTLVIKHDRAMSRELSPYANTAARGNNWMDIDNTERIAWVKKNPRLQDLVAKTRAIVGKEKSFMSQATIAAAWFLVERSAGESAAEAFFVPLITGAGLRAGDVRLPLRRTLINRAVSGNRVMSVEALHYIAKAWELRDETERRVFIVKDLEAFPFIR